MASSRVSLNGPDVVDVGVTIAAFEVMNKVRVAIRFGLVDVKGEGRLRYVAEAWPRDPEGGEASSSALVSVERTAERRQTMEAVTLQLLYALDFKLAETEWEGSDRQR